MEKRFGDIAEFVNGRAFKPKDWGMKGLPIIRIQNLTGTNEVFNYYEGDFDKRYLVKNDDILISWSASLGVYRWDKDDAVLNQHIFKVNLKDEIDKTYFYYAVQEKLIEMERQVHGSTMKHITKDKFDNLKISVPDLKTQQKFASLLEQADAARQKRKQANQLTEQFLQSAFLEMFGDPVKNEKGWELKRLEDASERTQIGPFGTQLHEEDYIENGIPLINPRHIVDGRIEIDFKQTITEEKFNTLTNYHLQVGDVIMGRRGEMGRCALISKKENGWLCGTGSLFIRPNKKLNPTFLIFVMRQESFVRELENKSQGVTMMNLNLTIINNLNIPLPPLPLQQKFASIVEQVEQLRVKQRESEQELENLFGSLMQKYFGN